MDRYPEEIQSDLPRSNGRQVSLRGIIRPFNYQSISLDSIAVHLPHIKYIQSALSRVTTAETTFNTPPTPFLDTLRQTSKLANLKNLNARKYHLIVPLLALLGLLE